ncbi:MAG: SGNH/GDSL hydrolase family protein [Kiritimatiellae bacterium]|nr:SGNH/GDSL hydrolase family protein [Kiritimatiellia bacterium]
MSMRSVWSAAVALIAALAMGAEPFDGKITFPDGALANARKVFEGTKRGTVAFLGGSITEMEGYRPMVCTNLVKRFPQTAFTFIPAGISSTCSSTGAFRLQRDILAKGPVDLLFVEFAVNDDQDGHFSRETCIRGMEGILRHARLANPKIDIVMTFFVNEAMLASYREGKVPLTISAHGAVAAHYGVPTVNLAKEVSEEIESGTLTWRQFGGVHPAPRGNAICARMIETLLDRAWSRPDTTPVTDYPLPAVMDPCSFFRGRLIDPQTAQAVSGWNWSEPPWRSIPGSKRGTFCGFPHFWTTTPGAEATVTFTGTAFGAYLTAGQDAGWLEVAIDGQPAKRFNLFHSYSAALHYPWTVLFSETLPDGEHRAVIRFPDIPENRGRAARLMSFTAN